MKTYNNIWDAVTELMDSETRERVHAELAPCTTEEFLSRYLELDPEFEAVLDQMAADE